MSSHIYCIPVSFLPSSVDISLYLGAIVLRHLYRSLYLSDVTCLSLYDALSCHCYKLVSKSILCDMNIVIYVFISICVEYLFPSFYFQVCAFRSEVSLL